MTPEHWQQIDNLFQEALQRPFDERSALLDEACLDEESRKEVESMISFYQQAGNFLEVPVFEAAATLFLEDRDEPLTGMTIGPYKVGAQIGAGGMGEVYLAEDTQLDRKVAIKFLPLDLEADEQAKMRLIREAKAAAKLDHPNICATYEVAEEDSLSFIVMQYVEGETLALRIQHKPLELCDALDVVVQVADSLVEAHSHGIIHRDIKPQNIMLTPKGQVKVLDFGLAKMIEPAEAAQSEARTNRQLSMPGMIIGTAPYMSPEQAKGAQVDARSDLFSLGVVLYECVAGSPPFSGVTSMDVCAQVILVDPPPPSHLNPHVPPDLDAVTLMALAKEPAARYQSAGDLLEDLRAVRASLGTKAESSILTARLKAHATSAGRQTTLSRVLERPPLFIIATVIVLALAFWAFYRVPPRGQVAPHQPAPEALSWYDQGTTALRNGAYYESSLALQQAINTDNEFALAHARLAEVWAEMDYDGKANYEILRARSLVRDLSLLQPADALYLQAVTYLVAREFTSAIESYKEIARQAQDDEKAFAYLDLGRAYERDDQIDMAIENYQIAAKFAPESPGVSLRLASLYGWKREIAKAEAEFGKAEKLCKAKGNSGGIIEVLYRRGELFISLEKLAQARPQLEEALAMAVTYDSKSQRIKSLLQLSRVSYLGGKIALAQQYATEARVLAQANRMDNPYTQALIELGSALLYGGDYGKAESYFAQALESAKANKATRLEARSLLSLGNTRLVQHDADGGLPYVEQALAIYQQGGYRKEASRALMLLARAKNLKGDYAAALQAYEQQLEIADRIGDESQVARAHAEIGNMLNLRERYPEALRHIDESIAKYVSLDNQQNAGYCFADRCDALWRLGRYEEAREALRQAHSIADEPDGRNKQLLAKICLIETHLTLSERRFPQAIEKARQALALDEETEEAINVKYALGLAEALSSEKRQGVRTCAEAVEMARRAKDGRMLPDALLALAEAMLESGDWQGALANALEAQRILAPAGRQESEWRAWLVAGRASQQAGDGASARDYLSRADNMLESLEVLWGAESYNLYLTRPDVQHYRDSLRQTLDVNR